MQRLLFLLFLCCGSYGMLSAQNCGPWSHQPNEVLTDTVIFQDTLTLSFGSSFVITRMEVGIRLHHTFLPDLDISLQSPSGQEIPLWEDRCGITDSLQVTFSDTAGALVCLPILQGFIAPPDGQLSAFNNEFADGDWVLIIRDDAPGDDGFIEEWCLLPNVEEVNCLAPSVNPVDVLGATSAQVSWEDNNMDLPDYWEIELVPAGELPDGQADFSNINTPDFVLSDLASATSYQVFVRAVCGPVPGSWSNAVTFSTFLPNPSPCNVQLPIPDFNCGLNNEFAVEVDNAPGSQLGTDVILKEVRLIVEHPWVADLEISLRSPSGQEVSLSSDNGSSGDHYGIPGDTTCSSFTAFSSASGLACQAADISEGVAPFLDLYLPEEPLSNLYDGTDPNGIWTLIICDDALSDAGLLQYFELVFEAQSCPAPSELTLIGKGADFANLSWSGGSGSCQSLILEYGPPGFLPGQSDTAGSVLGEVVIVNCPATLPYTLTGLSELTTYEIYIREQCGPDQYSGNSCPITFTTDCQVPAVSEEELWDGQASCATSCFEPCSLTGIWSNQTGDDLDWLVDAGGTSTPLTGPSDDVVGGGKYLYLETSSPCSDSSVALLSSQCMALPTAGAQCHFSFYYHLYGRDINRLALELTVDDGQTWVPIWEERGEQGDEWIKQFIDLQIFEGDTIRLRFLGQKGGGSYGDIALDELTFYGAQPLGIPADTFYRDADGDGFGDAQTFLLSCRKATPSGYVTNALDCRDDDSSLFPGAPEILCNGIDENCNGLQDDRLLPMPSISSNVEICSGQTLTLAPTDSARGQFYWYADAGQLQLLQVGDTFSAPVLQSQFVFVKDSVEGLACGSPLALIQIEAIPVPELLAPDTFPFCNDNWLPLDMLPVQDVQQTGADRSFYSGFPFSSGNFIADSIRVQNDTLVWVEAVNQGQCRDTLSLFIQSLANPEVSVQPDSNLVLCSGATAEAAVLWEVVPARPLKYAWNNGLTDSLITVVGSPAAGTSEWLVVTVTDPRGCRDTDSLLVQTATSVSGVSVNTQDVSSCNGMDGSIALNPINGVAPYQFSWQGPSSGDTLVPAVLLLDSLPQGSYRITITDASMADCPLVLPSVAVGGPSFMVNEVSVFDESCFQRGDGSIVLNISGGDPEFLWSSGDTTPIIDSLSAGSYSVTISDPFCTLVLEDILVNSPDSLFLSNITLQPASCAFSADGSITVAAAGGNSPYLYQWESGNTSNFLPNLMGGTYGLTISDLKSCSRSYSFEVVAPQPLSVVLDSVKPVSCFGQSNGALYARAEGGTGPYQWNWSNGGTSPVNDGLLFGAYQATVTDQNDCQVTSPSYPVPQPATLERSLSIIPPSCNGESDGSLQLTLSGGTPPYQYLWNTGDTLPQLTAIGEGVYACTVTDSRGCTLWIPDTLVQAPEVLDVQMVAQVDALCLGRDDGILELSVTGGQGPYEFLWSTGDTVSRIDQLSGGVYACTVTDVNGCFQVVDDLVIEQPQLLDLTVDLVDPVRCFGGADGRIFTTPNGTPGPFSYLWNDGATTPDRTQLESGAYSLTLTDVQGCQLTAAAIQVSQPDSLGILINSVEPVFCSGQSNGSIDIAPFGGVPPYAFNWDNGTAQEDLSQAPAGDFKLTVIDKNNCAVTTPPLTISEPPPLDVSVVTSQNVDCAGNEGGSADIAVTGGVPGYAYQWSNGSTSQDLQGVSAGTYAVTVTDENNCQVILPNVLVVEPADSLQIVVDSIQNLECLGDADGFLSVQILGGTEPYAFLWSNGVDNSLQLANLPAGTYDLTVTDSRGCSKVTTPVEIGADNPLLVDVEEVVQPDCYGDSTGSIALQVSGQGAFSYVWTDDGGDTLGSSDLIIDSLGPGTYTCIIVDAKGCQRSSIPQTIVWPAELLVAVDTILPTCPGDSTGSILPSISGGKPGYSLHWSTGVQSPSLSSVAAGLYSLQVTDAGGCTQTLDSIAVPSLPGAPLRDSLLFLESITCQGGSDGRISVGVLGGVPEYNILWSTGQTDTSVEQLSSGVYTLTVTDTRGCTHLGGPYLVTEPDSALEVALIDIQDNLCADKAEGSIATEASGGTPPYIYAWSHGESLPIADALSEGFYELSVEDANGCLLSFGPWYVDAPPAWQLVPFSTPSTAGQMNGEAWVVVLGAVPPYQFQWDAAAGNQTDSVATGLPPGVYTLSLSDANDCDTSIQVAVGVISSVTPAMDTAPNFRVFPNPTSGLLGLSLSADAGQVVEEEWRFRLYNSLGQQMLSFQRSILPGQPLWIDISAWPAGVYFLEMSNGDHKVLKKVVKE